MDVHTDKTGQTSIRDSCHRYRTPQIAEEARPDRGCSHSADVRRCVVTVLLLCNRLMPPQLPLNIGE